MRKRYTKHRKIKKFFVSAVFLMLLTAALFGFEMKVRPVIRTVALSRARSLAVRSVSDVVNETMAKTHITYSDLVIFQKNKDDNITAVTSNVVEINKLKARLTADIEKKLSESETITSNIPLGTLLGQSFLSGKGPKITLKMIPLGFTLIDIKNEFTSAGINQTRHEIYLDVRCNMSVLLPAAGQNAEISTQVPLAETIIVGTVPDTFTSVTGQEDPQDSALNLLP